MLRRVLFCLFVFLLGVAASKSDATKRLLAGAADGDGDAIVAALAAGADPNARSESKTPALVTVATKTFIGSEKTVVAAFVKAKANVDATDTDGSTPLMAAAATDLGRSSTRSSPPARSSRRRTTTAGPPSTTPR